jgi:hypothetical protein
LAAVAASQAFREASSSASRDAMRALAVAKASVTLKKGKKNRIKKQGKIHEKGERRNTDKKITLRSSSSLQKFDTFSAQRDELLHQDLSRGKRE